eukprot:12938819-Prorocentrum_lima.AAC.1
MTTVPRTDKSKFVYDGASEASTSIGDDVDKRTAFIGGWPRGSPTSEIEALIRTQLMALKIEASP